MNDMKKTMSQNIEDTNIDDSSNEEFDRDFGSPNFYFVEKTWVSGLTTSITVIDRNNFEKFLVSSGVVFLETSGSFQLYTGYPHNWPCMNEDDLLFKGELIEQHEDQDSPRDPLSFWRAVSKYMVPNTFFRVMELGYVCNAPFVFGRETGFFAMAITVTAEGEVTVQDFEDYFVCS